MEIAQMILGHPGLMIGASKSRYVEKKPRNLVVFNSNIFLGKEKIWYGDVDVTEDREKLKQLAVAVGGEILVLREMDGRFEHEKSPVLKNFVYKVDEHGRETLGLREREFYETEGEILRVD